MEENCVEAADMMKPLMETLRHQQDLLQELYTELDVEREASATATNESLSMILRLQGEKAAVEMEASQYKRIAEEKMFHAQETLETFRDLIYQKEMQIASLEFQVQAYRFKLVSLGCKDVGEIESTFPVKMLSRTSTCGLPPRTVKRGCSLPPEFLQNDAIGSNGSSLIVLPEAKDSDLAPSKSSDFSSYWQQIKKLDQRVKELSISKDLVDEMSNSYSSFTRRVDDDTAVPSTVHDIFEVPEASNGEENGELSTDKTATGGVDKNNLIQREAASSDAVEHVVPKPDLQFNRPDVTDFEIQQMNRRLKRLEDERIMASQEIYSEDDDEKFMLLKLIKNQLNTIEDEIISLRRKELTLEKDANRTPLTESQEIAKDGAMSKALGWNGAKLIGKEAAKAREHGMELAKGSKRMYGSSDNVVASIEEKLSRVNTLLSRQCISEKKDIARLTSLMDRLSMPKPSARTSADVENTSEPSKVRFRECEEIEDRWF